MSLFVWFDLFLGLTPILSPFLDFINQNHSLKKLSRIRGCPHFIRTWSKKNCPGFQDFKMGTIFLRSDSDIRKSNVTKEHEWPRFDFTPLASNGSILYPLMNHFSKCFYTTLLQRLNHKNHVQKATSLHEQLQEHLLKNLSCKYDKLQFVISPHEQLPIRKVYSIDLPPRHCN